MLRGSALLAFGLVATIVHAQAPQVPGRTLSKAPTIDGIVSAEEWAEAARVDSLQDERSREAVPDAGTYYIAYDSTAIYFAAIIPDADPSRIQASEYRANVSLRGNDHVGFSLDLSGSLSDFSEFRFNANGATEIELAGGRAAKTEWLGEVVSKGRITDKGWEVEARIPWKIMNLPGEGERDVRLNIVRWMPRATKFLLMVSTNGGFEKDTPRWTGIRLPRQPVDRSIRFLPYTLLGYDPDQRGLANMGVDIKTKLSDQHTLVGSINPDFRNIENQILSLDFSRFERLAQESRPFFQEGSGYMGSAIYASQRIRRFDVGVNAYGKLSDKLQYGLLNTNDFGDQNAFVGNFAYSPTTTEAWRGTITSLREPGRANDAYLLRYSRQQGPLSMMIRQMGSEDREAGAGTDRVGNLTYFRDNLFAQASYVDREANFRPRLGFIPETGFRGPSVAVSKVFQYEKGPFNLVGSKLEFDDLKRHDGRQYRRTRNWDFFTALRNRVFITGNFDWTRFEGSEDRLAYVSTQYPFQDPYRSTSLTYSWGDLQGTKYDSLRVDLSQRPMSELQLTGAYQVVRFGGYEQQAILGFNYDLKRDRSLSGRVVRAGDDWNAYVAFRRSGGRGLEYFLIFGDPNARSTRSSVILKVVSPFQIG